MDFCCFTGALAAVRKQLGSIITVRDAFLPSRELFADRPGQIEGAVQQQIAARKPVAQRRCIGADLVIETAQASLTFLFFKQGKQLVQGGTAKGAGQGGT